MNLVSDQLRTQTIKLCFVRVLELEVKRKHDYFQQYYARNRERRLANSKAYVAEHRSDINRQRREYRHRNPEKPREWNRKFYKNHAAQILKRNKQYYSDNSAECYRRARRWRQQNQGKVKEYDRNHYRRNRTLRIKRAMDWYYTHKKEVNRKRGIRMLKRQSADLEYRLLCRLRTHVSTAVKRKSDSKRTRQLIGCSMTQLRQRLESLFQPGMTWQNYGRNGWEIDHVTPIDLFNLSDPTQLACCFHYTNLQPLWARENRSKRNRLCTHSAN